MRVVLCNCSPDEAESLAHTLVQERLAACVNVLQGVQSVYFWQGEVHQEIESTLLIKVAADGVEALRTRLVSLHSYDTVEFLCLPVLVAESEPKYVQWVRDTVGSAS
jgi:periplasmic divalent cation tolerance protein